jgi:hypothetical protein
MGFPYNDERMKSGMSRWLDTCKRKQHPGVVASSPLAPEEVGLPFRSQFGSLFRTLIERCEYVSLHVLQNRLSAKLALHVTAVLATTSKMNRLPRVYIVLLQNEQIAAIIRVDSALQPF